MIFFRLYNGKELVADLTFDSHPDLHTKLSQADRRAIGLPHAEDLSVIFQVYNGRVYVWDESGIANTGNARGDAFYVYWLVKDERIAFTLLHQAAAQ